MLLSGGKMANNLSVAREKLAEAILKDFKDKVTGATDTPVVGENPENIFFVGKLLTNGSESNSNYSSDVFIESVGMDFYINKDDPDKFRRLKIKLVPVYQKVSIAAPNCCVSFKPADLLDVDGNYGFLDERSQENRLLNQQTPDEI